MENVYYNKQAYHLININDSKFFSCNDIFNLYFGEIHIDRCQFQNISSTFGEAAIINLMLNSKLVIKNSIISDININHITVPLIKNTGKELNIYNVTINHAYTGLGYLIEYDYEYNDDNVIYVKDSLFDDVSPLFYGENVDLHVDNTKFLNLVTKSSYSPISSLKYGSNYINNCVINNISLFGSSLFDDYSSIYISNTVIDGVSTIYKPIIKSTYKNIKFDKVDLKNINIYGDDSECNLFNVDMGKNQDQLLIENSNITNIQSNGRIFNIKGSVADVQFNQVNINNSTSFGLFLTTNADENHIYFHNSTFTEVRNLNKHEMGLILLNRDIHVNITYSDFSNNESYSCGLLYFNQTRNLNYYVYKSTFYNNKSKMNGGIVSFIDESEDIENKYQKIFNVEYSVFQDNSVNYFGAVFYTSILNNYDITIHHTDFIRNTAGVAGGCIFLEQINKRIKGKIEYFMDPKRKLFYNKYINNTAKSHGINFATHPEKFIQTEKKETGVLEPISLKSGEPFNMVIELQDSLGNVVIDNEKYYSNIGIQMELLDENYNLVNTTDYYLPECITSFNNGLNFIRMSEMFIRKPGTYYLNIKAKTTIFYLLKETDCVYQLNIADCGTNEIKLYNSDGFYYCEEPKCRSHLNEDNVICIKGNDYINDPDLNHYICKDGMTGDNCDQYLYYNIDKYKNIHYTLTVSVTLIMVVVTIFIIINKHYLIINDLGFKSMMLISLGCIIENLSNMYVTSDNISNCYLHPLIMYIGFILIYIPYTVKTLISSTFGLKFNYSNRDYTLINSIFSTNIKQILFLSEKNNSSSCNLSHENNKSSITRENKSLNNLSDNRSLHNLYQDSVNKSCNNINNESKNYNMNGESSKYTLNNESTRGFVMENSDYFLSNLHSSKNLLLGSCRNLMTSGSGNLSAYTNTNKNLTISKRNATIGSFKNIEQIVNEPETSVNDINIEKMKKKKKQEDIEKNFKERIRNTYDTIVILILISLVLIIPLSLNKLLPRNSTLSASFMVNNSYAHVCPYAEYDIAFYIIKLILLLYNLTKFQDVNNGSYIYIDSKIISHLNIAWIVMDPCINIILYALFVDSKLVVAEELQYYSNLLCCCTLFFGYYYIIIHIILKNHGNDIWVYLLNLPKQKCIIHNSYSCECPTKKIEQYDENELKSFYEYVKFYNDYFNLRLFLVKIFRKNKIE
ncbi:hypothetical protein BCR32DRAFT_268738 [Anaeromyces robustus]|uniref:Uncharacterized protein n=1 Tax=Anaeromyces robustus TaxID=1754192 RepID=A0A1Y1X4M4_9FUNG|nr:hypothetical protein BCR32DRAFT_268738 [Anaeromyces robustus]|eukprot:ORX80652.1 hypothetical protein BCR32DRAFT_268738 [Anaeromyces robustus]